MMVEAKRDNLSKICVLVAEDRVDDEIEVMNNLKDSIKIAAVAWDLKS